jgi:hypothetical protein
MKLEYTRTLWNTLTTIASSTLERVGFEVLTPVVIKIVLFTLNVSREIFLLYVTTDSLKITIFIAIIVLDDLKLPTLFERRRYFGTFL